MKLTNTYFDKSTITFRHIKEVLLMELRVLNYFLTVAREKTISRAAEILHVSQPTLSKQLKELENELGVILFILGNRSITLTEEGLYLKKRSEDILSLTNQTKANLQKNEIPSGTLSIGGGETVLFRLIAEIVNELLVTYPDVTSDFFSGNSDDVLEKIDRGLLDFALVIDPVIKQKYEYIQLPYVDTWGVLINENHILAQKKAISAKDLMNVPLLHSSQSLINDQFSDWLGKNSDYLTIIGHYNLLYNASLLSELGDIAILCIDGIINTTETNLTFIQLSPPLTSNVTIIWKKDNVLSSISKLFLKKLQAKLALLPKNSCSLDHISSSE